MVCPACFYIDVVDMARYKSRICPSCRRKRLVHFMQTEDDCILRIGDEQCDS